MTKILIPAPLRQYTGQQAQIETAGATVADALAQLTAAHPDLHKHLFTDDGRLRSFVNVYVNDEDIRYLGRDATPLAPGDTVSLVPSIAGGR